MYNKKFFWGSVFLGVMILLGAWFFQVFTDLEIASRLMAAILGVVITAIITQLLLQGQTDKEEHLRKNQQEWQIAHDRNNTVFGEKLKIYQKFLDTLYNAVKDEELTASKKLDLQYQTSLVAMHCEPENIQELSKAVRQVITVVCEPSKKKSPNENALLKTLFDVVEALRKDLYAKDFKPFPSDVKEQTIGNFNAAYNKAKQGEDDAEDIKQHLSVDLNVLSDVNHVILSASNVEGTLASAENKTDAVIDQQKYNISLWNQAVERWTNDDWTVTSLESENCPLQITRNDGNPGMIDMGFYDNHYYIQARYDGDWNFSKCLKWDNGGRRQRELWWEYPPLSMDVPKGGFIDKFKSSPDLQQYIVKKVEYLMDVILKNDQTTRWMKEVGPHDDWTLFTWYWSTLACEYQKDDEGKVYMDTRPSDDNPNVAIIQLGNRANNVEMLKKTLARIGCADKIKDIDEKDCYVNLDTTTSIEPKVVGERLRYWIGKISEKNKSNN